MAPARTRTHLTGTAACRHRPVHRDALPQRRARHSVKFEVMKRDGTTIPLSTRRSCSMSNTRRGRARVVHSGDVVTTRCLDNPTEHDLSWGGSSENEMFTTLPLLPEGALSCAFDPSNAFRHRRRIGLAMCGVLLPAARSNHTLQKAVEPLAPGLRGCSDASGSASSAVLHVQLVSRQAVIDARCVACHDGRGSAGSPFGLTTADDFTRSSPEFPDSPVYRRAQLRIHDVEHPMPPQGGLTESELLALDAWFASGARAGSEQCAPPASTADDGWPTDCEQTYRILAHDLDDVRARIAFRKTRSAGSVCCSTSWATCR